VSRRKVIIDGQEVDFTVVQADPTKLKATVAPSGDMARKAYYDRNPSTINKYFNSNVVAGTSWTVAWTYTVPTNRKAIHSVLAYRVAEPIATSGKRANAIHEWSGDGGTTWQIFAAIYHYYGVGEFSYETITVIFGMVAGEMIRSRYVNFDTADHWILTTSLLTEFDA